MSLYHAIRLPSTTRRAPRGVACAVVSISLALGCASTGRSSANALENREWRLAEVRGRPAVLSTGMRQAGIRFSPDSMRVSGSGGCNRIMGTYSRDDNRLSFGPVMATKMACADASLNRQETDFLSALQSTTRYDITSDTLSLARDGERLARLVSAPR